jgi:AcrR family transcriptional regulator
MSQSVTTSRRGRPSNRGHVLQAAMTVAMREGPGAVTIDAVVAESGLSRGGVLYHFPSKDALLQALVNHDLAAVRDLTGLDTGEAAARTSQERARAYYEACTSWPPERGHVALAVALATNPALLTPWAEVQRELDAVDADSAGSGADDTGQVGAHDAVAAVVARLALDGLWFSDLIDAERFAPEQRERVVAAILAVAEPDA